MNSWMRLTKTELPIGNCEHREYDAQGRLSYRKVRDNCTAASGGDTAQYTYDADSLLIEEKFLDDAGTTKKQQEYSDLRATS